MRSTLDAAIAEIGKLGEEAKAAHTGDAMASGRVAELEASLADAQVRSQGLESSLSEKQAALSEAHVEITELRIKALRKGEGRISELEAALSEKQAALAKAHGEITELRLQALRRNEGRATELEVSLKEAHAKGSELAESLARQAEREGSLEAALSEVRAQLEQRAAHVASLEQTLRQQRGELQETRASVQEQREKSEKKDNDISALSASLALRQGELAAALQDAGEQRARVHLKAENEAALEASLNRKQQELTAVHSEMTSLRIASSRRDAGAQVCPNLSCLLFSPIGDNDRLEKGELGGPPQRQAGRTLEGPRASHRAAHPHRSAR